MELKICTFLGKEEKFEEESLDRWTVVTPFFVIVLCSRKDRAVSELIFSFSSRFVGDPGEDGSRCVLVCLTFPSDLRQRHNSR